MLKLISRKKKLFISLLRAGDFIMQRPLMASQAIEHEVHVLINDEFQQLKSLYPEFIFHFFPRQELQALINQPHSSLLKPFENLRELMSDLNSENFDEIFNLTHNRLSGYLMDQLSAQVKRGLQFKDDKFLPLENKFQAYFNETFSTNDRSSIHYLAVLAKSVGLAVPRLYAAENRFDKNTVYLQVLTSDEKKNWSLHKWMALFQQLKTQHPQFKYKVLAAPFELEKLKAYFNPQDLEVTTLFELREQLKSARMLITGDTSAAHLAAETRTPCLVLSLGSSDPTKTSPWMFGAWTITTATTCAPCRHSSPCSQKLHLCSEDLKFSTVLSVFNGIQSDRQNFGLIAPAILFRNEYDLHHVLKLKAYSAIGGFYDEGKSSSLSTGVESP
jgi:ADP-heptose:LPS heptosyltransferase